MSNKYINNLINKFINARIILVGFGKENISTYQFIRSQLPTLPLIIADTDTSITNHQLIQNDQYLDCYTGDHYSAAFRQEYDLLIKSPGVIFDSSLAIDEKKITSQAELFFSVADCRIVGITGTKGKSTTASLLAHIARGKYTDVRLLGNIGAMPFDTLNTLTSDSIIIYELSSFQIEYLHHVPNIAILLNIYAEHLDHHGTIDAYHASKLRLATVQKTTDTIIYNQDDSTLCTYTKQFPAHQQYTFSTTTTPLHGVAIQNNTVIVSQMNNITATAPLPKHQLAGAHNLYNIAAAIAGAIELDIDMNTILATIGDFQPLPHRLEYVGIYHDINWYNDSISTIPQTTIAALQAIPQTTTIIIGGLDRGISYQPLFDYLEQHPVSVIIGLPVTGHTFVKQLQQHTNQQTQYFTADTIEQAVALAIKHTPVSGVCLLSPAAASFNQFIDYQQRGNAFKQAIRS